MSSQAYLSVLLRHWGLIVVLALVGALAAFGYSQTVPPTYRSTTSVILVPEQGSSPTELVQGSTYVQNLVQSYAVLAGSPLVLQPVVDELSLAETPGQLEQSLTVEPQIDTVVIDISYVGTSPQQTQQVAAAVGAELAEAVEIVSPRATGGGAAVTVATIAPASAPQQPIAPRRNLLLVLGLGLGGALGVGLALLRHARAQRTISPAAPLEELGTPVIGEVAELTRGSDMASSVLEQPSGGTSESLRALVANLAVTRVDGIPATILVTSGSSGEGKSSISLGLSALLAETGKQVLLVDADLRLPRLAGLTQLEGAVGLSTVILGEVTLDQAAQPWGPPGMRILTSGAVQSNPGHLLSSGRLREVLARAGEQYDHVVIDSPPVLDVSDPVWLAPLSQGVLVVARSGRSRRRDLLRALDRLSATGTDVLGLVLNRVPRSERSPYYRAPTRSARLRRRRRASS